MEANNAQKMREALTQIHALATSRGAWDIATVADTALKSPRRQCDVGTAEEQTIRYRAFCYRMMKQNNHCCGPCPCYEFVNGEAQPCTLLWAQMPYEEGGAK